MKEPRIYEPGVFPPVFPPLTEEQKAELEYLKTMSDDEIDYSDIPKMTAEDFKKTRFFYAHDKNGKLITRA